MTLGKHAFYEEGIQLYNQGLFPEALEKFKKITTHGQEETSLHYNLASFYSGLIHRNLGLLFLHKGDYQEAIAHFNMALEFNPTHYEIYNYLGIAYNNWKKYQKAMASFSKVLELAPELLSLRYKVAIVLYNLKKYDEALEEIQHLVELNPKFADLHYHLGVVYAHQRRFEEAHEAFSRALDLNPKYLQAKIQVSLMLATLGRHDSAIETLTDIIKEKPYYPDLYYNVGVIQAAQKNWKEALGNIKKALEINPNYADAHFILGVLYLKDNEYDLAEKEIQKALDLDLEGIRRALAKSLLEYLGRRKKIKPTENNLSLSAQLDPLEEEYLETMLQSFPQHLPIVPDYVEILEKSGTKWDRPLLATLARLYEDQIIKTPNYADLHYQLGKVYDQMESRDKAIMSFSRSLEINPLFFKARIHLYQLFLKVEMQERAKKELEFLMEKGIRFPDICLDLGQIYFNEENWDSALSCLDYALEKNPKFEKAFLLASAALEKKGEIEKALEVLDRFKTDTCDFTNEVTLRILELKKKRSGSRG